MKSNRAKISVRITTISNTMPKDLQPIGAMTHPPILVRHLLNEKFGGPVEHKRLWNLVRQNYPLAYLDQNPMKPIHYHIRRSFLNSEPSNREFIGIFERLYCNQRMYSFDKFNYPLLLSK